MLRSFHGCRAVVVLLLFGSFPGMVSTVMAGIVIDNFPAGGGLGGSGITVNHSPASTSATGTGIASTSVLGGSRIATLTLENLTDKRNTGVNLKIPGGSGGLQYKSDNNTANGLFDLLYNGAAAGPPSFPLDFSSALAEIIINVHFHTNPGSNHPTVFTVTLFDNADTSGPSASAIQNLTSGVSGGLDLHFAGFSPQAGFDFSNVKAIEVNVNPYAGTNIELKEISTTATVSDDNNHGQGDPVPEPGSMLTWALLGFAAVLYRRRDIVA